MDSESTHSLPPLWSRYFDDVHAAFYYHNNQSGLTQWVDPSQASSSNECPGIMNSDTGIRELSKARMPTDMLLEEGPPIEKQAIDFGGNYSDMDDDPDGVATYNVAAFDIPDDKRHLLMDRSVNIPSLNGLDQDYLEMAKLYKKQRPYSDSNYSKTCVLCQKTKATHVFFPCEHHCVCIGCIELEEICSDSKLSSRRHGCCNCSLCGTIIKKILPFDYGNEIELYWSWVYEFPPPLSADFLKNFKHSADVIKTVYSNSNADQSSDQSENSGTTCALS